MKECQEEDRMAHQEYLLDLQSLIVVNEPSVAGKASSSSSCKNICHNLSTLNERSDSGEHNTSD
jgi:hypothetical protein